MDTIELTIIAGKEHKFYNLVNKGMGSSCLCYSAIDSEQRQYLIKEFKATDKFVEQKSIQLRNAITVIKNAYIARCGNYQLDDALIGYANVNGKKQYYQVFRFVSGREIECFNSTLNKVENALSLFLDLLKSLRIFHEDLGMLHFDIKPSNIYTYFDNPGSFQNAQLLDFDSAKTIDEFISDLSGRNPNKKFIYSSSFPWYSTEDFQKFTSNDPRNLRYSYNPLKYCLSLDLTASARVFSYMLCGNDANESGKLPPSQEELTRYLEQLPQEGIRFALERFFAKAFADELKDRYLNVSDMIDDITAIIEASQGKPSSAMAWNIREKNNSQLKEIYQLDSLYKVENHKIDVGILADIKCEELGSKIFSFDEDKGSALAQLLDATNKHIWLVGDAGGGKSTATDYLYLESLRKHFTDVAIVYTKLSDCKFGEDYSTIELSKIADTLKLDKLNSPVIILLDGYDEIKRRRALGSQQEQEKFDTAFVKAIEKKSNFRFVISSRFLPEVVRESKTFISATNQSLRDKNIYEYLQIDHDGINRINKNQALLKLLRNPFCLTLFSALKAENANIAYEITMESDLIEKYLWSTYKSKAEETQNKKSFDRFIAEIARITLNNVCVDENIYENIYEKPIIHYFNNYIDLKPSDQNNYEFCFGHELIREWFVGYGMRNKFLELTNNIDWCVENIGFLDCKYSYETLKIFSQMILCSKDIVFNQENKSVLEILCKQMRQITPLKPSKGVHIQIPPIAVQEKCKIPVITGEALIQEYFDNREEYVYCIRYGHDFEKNMVNIVAFAYNGDMTNFDFGTIDYVAPYAFEDCSFLDRVIIPGYFRTIGDNAFAQCESLKSVELYEGIETIQKGGFYGCNSITEINIPHTVTQIGFCSKSTVTGVFEGCRNLKKVILSQKLKIIGNSSFAYCETLEDIDIPDTVTDIGADVFTYTGLRKIKLSNSMTEISRSCFETCDLENVVIPEGVTYIGESAFSDCVNLSIVELPSTLEHIGICAFGHTGLKKLIIPARVSKIDVDAFDNCFDLERIFVDKENVKYQSWGNCLIDNETQTLIRGCQFSIIPSDGRVKYIGDGAFSDCMKLKEIEIPEGITEIDEYAFSGCLGLKSVELPETLTVISSGAFYECSSLKSIYIPQNCTRIQAGVFIGCTNLEEIIVAPENKEYYSVNNCLIKAKTKTLLATCMKSAIPFDGSIVRIGNSAFDQRVDLLEVTVPDKVVSIGNRAFRDCDNIESIILPDGLEVIGNSAFWGCDALSYINIPKTVSRIGQDVFSKCKSLREILLPQGLKCISEGMFYACGNLKCLNIPNGVTSIGANVFQRCNNLETVTISITVTNIGDSIFYDCFRLTSVRYGGTKRDWENIIKIAPEGEQWSIGNDCKWAGLNHKFPIKIQCIDGIIEY